MVSPFPIKMHYGAFEKGNAEKQILILSLQFISKLLLSEKERKCDRLNEDLFNILICVVGKEVMRYHFTNALENLLHFSRRVIVHVYAQESTFPIDYYRRLDSIYPHQLKFHRMKSPAGTGTLLKKEILDETLFFEKGNAVILVDLDNINVDLSDVKCKHFFEN
jgi:hypothetical protein